MAKEARGLNGKGARGLNGNSPLALLPSCHLPSLQNQSNKWQLPSLQSQPKLTLEYQMFLLYHLRTMLVKFTKFTAKTQE
jgi:hypothetical protein